LKALRIAKSKIEEFVASLVKLLIMEAFAVMSEMDALMLGVLINFSLFLHVQIVFRIPTTVDYYYSAMRTPSFI
jgi:hypothetical protein